MVDKRHILSCVSLRNATPEGDDGYECTSELALTLCAARASMTQHGMSTSCRERMGVRGNVGLVLHDPHPICIYTGLVYVLAMRD